MSESPPWQTADIELSAKKVFPHGGDSRSNTVKAR